MEEAIILILAGGVVHFYLRSVRQKNQAEYWKAECDKTKKDLYRVLRSYTD